MGTRESNPTYALDEIATLLPNTPTYRVLLMGLSNENGQLSDDPDSQETSLIVFGLYEDYDLVCVSDGHAYFQLRRNRDRPSPSVSDRGPQPYDIDQDGF